MPVFWHLEELINGSLIVRYFNFVNYACFVESTCGSMIFSLQKWQRYTERQPLRFYDRELLPHLAYVTRRLAKFVGLALFYLSIKSFFFIVMSYKNAFLYKRIFFLKRFFNFLTFGCYLKWLLHTYYDLIHFVKEIIILYFTVFVNKYKMRALFT